MSEQECKVVTPKAAGRAWYEEARELPALAESEVLVCGGGPAGIGAALAAARRGAKTTLIDVHGCLGGVWTAGQLTWIFEGDNPGLATEIAEALVEMGARRGKFRRTYSYDVEAMKVLCERLCQSAGVKIRLHTRVVDAVRGDRGRITHVLTESKSGRELWPARLFVDCSGDGDLGAMAGCGYDLGGPAGEFQPCTLMGLIAVEDVRQIAEYISFFDQEAPDWANHQACIDKFQALMKQLGISLSYGRPTIFHVAGNLCALMINHEYRVSALDAQAITEATLRGRAEIYRVVQALRTLGGGWAGTTLAATAEQIGIREGRRLHGLYRLVVDDLQRGAEFADQVCSCGFGVDVHSPDPQKDKGLSNAGVKARRYQIPYRALVAREVGNLLMAGRCISGDWLAHASYRCTGTAVATGEAAGRAAAFCARTGRLPGEVAWAEIADR